MRLGQLARKLAIKPAEIKDYLEKQGVPFEGTSNNKIPDEYVGEIMQYFSPNLEEEVVEMKVDITDESPSISNENEIEPIEAESEILPETDQEELVEMDVPLAEMIEETSTAELAESSIVSGEMNHREEEPKEVVLTVQDILAEEEAISGEEGEEKKNSLNISTSKILIKAPKVSLPGLKVVGKIDIPEPVKKEDKIETGEPSDSQDTLKENTELRTSKPRQYQRKDGRGQNRNKRRPLTLEEKRERERRNAERKRKSEEKKKKELKKEHYLKQVKGTPSVKPKKTKKEKSVVQKKVVKGPAPKTVFGKFWRWLNT